MSTKSTIILLAFVFENKYLIVFPMFYDTCFHRSSLDIRFTYLHALIIS